MTRVSNAYHFRAAGVIARTALGQAIAADATNAEAAKMAQEALAAATAASEKAMRHLDGYGAAAAAPSAAGGGGNEGGGGAVSVAAPDMAGADIEVQLSTPTIFKARNGFHTM